MRASALQRGLAERAYPVFHGGVGDQDASRAVRANRAGRLRWHGQVWKARDTRLDRIVALKRLKAEHSVRFEQEARAIAALNHPHICALYDIGPDYLVMEYVEGTPVSGPMPAERALKLAIQIASALEEAHGK